MDEVIPELPASLLSLLHLTDSAFPTGGFSHSGGVEAAFQRGLLNTEKDARHVVTCICENAASLCLPFLRMTYESQQTPEELLRIDSAFQSMMTNHVACRGSVEQGRSLVRTVGTILRSTNSPSPMTNAFLSYEKLVEINVLRGHLVISWAVLCKHLELTLDTASMSFLFLVLRGALQAIVRLGAGIGMMMAQSLQWDLQLNLLPRLVDEHSELRSPCRKHPVIDIIQNTHDTLFSKLFYS